MAYVYPPYEPTRFNPAPYNARISSLIGQRSDVDAQAEYAKGQATANAWSSIGNIIGQTMGNLIAYRENAPRRELEQLQLRSARQNVTREEREASRKSNLEGLTRMAADLRMSGLEAAQLFSSEGYHDESTRILQNYKTIVQAKAEEEALKWSQIDDRMKRASEAYRPVMMATTPDAEQRAWETARPKILELVPPEIAAQLPQQHSPDVGQRVRELGMTLGQVAQVRADLAKQVASEREAGKLQFDEAMKKVAKVLPTVDTPEEYDTLLETIRYFAKPDDSTRDGLNALGLGTQWTPETAEAVKRAAAMFGETTRGSEGFSLSPGQVRFGPEGERIASVPPRSDAEGGVTPAVRRQAEQWRSEQLMRAQDDARAALERAVPAVDQFGDPVLVDEATRRRAQAAAQAVFDDRVRQIEETYRSMLGAPQSQPMSSLAESGRVPGPGLPGRGAPPPPPPVRPGQRGVIRLEQLSQRARELGMSEAEAIRDAEARGYIVR